MGLDIKATSKVRLVEVVTNGAVFDEKYWVEQPESERGKFVMAYAVNEEHGVRAKPLVAPLYPDYAVYHVDGEVLNFRAGSYSGYNEWRETLSMVANKLPASAVQHQGGAKYFYELIDFSDCEGIIGPEAAERLHADFISCAPKFVKRDDYFRGKYDLWTRAFELAMDGGLVDFH